MSKQNKIESRPLRDKLAIGAFLGFVVGQNLLVGFQATEQDRQEAAKYMLGIDGEVALAAAAVAAGKRVHDLANDPSRAPEQRTNIEHMVPTSAAQSVQPSTLPPPFTRR